MSGAIRLGAYLGLCAAAACGSDALRPDESRGERARPDYVDVVVTHDDQPLPEDPNGSDDTNGGEDTTAPIDPPADEPDDEAAPDDPPPADTVCDRIEALAGACPDYGYDCPAYPESQSQCFLDVLLALPDPCLVFRDGSLCQSRVPSLLGIASCDIQECFLITHADECYASLEILCDYAY
jgi:hypothetical protein